MPELVALLVLCLLFLGMPCVMVSFPATRFGWLLWGETTLKTQLERLCQDYGQLYVLVPWDLHNFPPLGAQFSAADREMAALLGTGR